MNENRNGVVRKVLPKGSAFDAILDEEMRLKPALQAELKTAILPSNHKKVLA